jgi:hypothetical protein
MLPSWLTSITGCWWCRERFCSELKIRHTQTNYSLSRQQFQSKHFVLVFVCVFVVCVTHLLLPGCALLFPEALPADANVTPACMVPLPWKRRTDGAHCCTTLCSAATCCLV